MTHTGRPPRLIAISAVIYALIGLYMLIGGAWLVAIGGSFYYAIAGIGVLITSLLMWKRKAGAFWLYGLVLIGTLIWAVYEVGFDFWKLAPRGDIIAPMAIWLLLPFVAKRIAHGKAAKAFLGATIAAAAVVLGVALSHDPESINGVADFANEPAGLAAGKDWTAYGGTNLGNRFSSLDQITPANVKKLKLAWQFQTGDMRGPNDPGETTDEVTPLKVGDTLYACSPHQFVFAIDAETGKLKWKFDPHLDSNKTFQHLTCRGVSYHETKPGAVTINGTPAPMDCPRRIYLATDDGFLYAINADDGKLCPSFGQN
ncbi:membrane-bound PQQ-dependent dehydrogenase, glucose/quinate/shikimate family, partial [Thioclava sp. BHET1]